MKKHIFYITIILYLLLFCISLNTELFNLIQNQEIIDKIETPKTIEPKHIFLAVVILTVVSVLGYSYFCHYIDIPNSTNTSGSVTPTQFISIQHYNDLSEHHNKMIKDLLDIIS